MKQEYPKFLFWMGLILKFFSRYYLALPALLLLFFGLGSITLFLIGLALFAVNFGIAYFEQWKTKRAFEQSSEDPQLESMRSMFMGNDWQNPPKQTTGDVIDVDATEITIDENRFDH